MNDLRHQVAHLQLVRPEDRPRFRRLGVVANLEGLWVDPQTPAVTLLPGQALSLAQAFATYTGGSAFVNHREGTGHLQVGARGPRRARPGPLRRAGRGDRGRRRGRDLPRRVPGVHRLSAGAARAPLDG
jgi:hypothetical protein